MEYLIEKVFQEFQKNLRQLLEKHDKEILSLQGKIEDLSREIVELRLRTTNDKWKLFIAVMVGAGSGKGVEKLFSLFF